jgi:glycosyltransferase involved in cell wall biosynthesis
LSALVSVVMPVFNTEKFVAEAIESVLSQEAELRLELIVVDDGSSDGSAEAVAKFDSVRLLRHEQNRGIGAARNTGVRTAKGEFVAFLDADDVWPRNSLGARMALLETDANCDAVAGRVIQFGEGRLDSESEGGFLAGNTLVRRPAFDRVGEFDETLRVGEFLDWYARAVDAGLRFSQIEALTLRRRVHASNTMLGIGKEPLDYTRVLRQALARRRAGPGE